MDLGSAAIAIVIAVSIITNVVIARRQESRYNEEQRRQTKVASANLAYKILRAWRTEGWFIDLLSKIRDPNAVPDEADAYSALDLFEDIAVLWNDGTLNESHVKEFFGTNLNNVRNNHAMMGFMDALRKNDPEYYYVNLDELLKRVEKWGIKSQFSGGRLPPEPPLTNSL